MSNCFRYPCILLSKMSNCFIYLIIHGQTPPRGWPGACRRALAARPARVARLLAVLPALPVARPLGSPMVAAQKLRARAASPGEEPAAQPAKQRVGGSGCNARGAARARLLACRPRRYAARRSRLGATRGGVAAVRGRGHQHGSDARRAVHAPSSSTPLMLPPASAPARSGSSAPPASVSAASSAALASPLDGPLFLPNFSVPWKLK